MNILHFCSREVCVFTNVAKHNSSAKEAADELNLLQSNSKELSNYIHIVHMKDPTTNTHTFWMNQYSGKISFHMRCT